MSEWKKCERCCRVWFGPHNCPVRTNPEAEELRARLSAMKSAGDEMYRAIGQVLGASLIQAAQSWSEATEFGRYTQPTTPPEDVL